MTYKLEYDPQARKALQKMDPFQRNLVLKWIDIHLNNCTNPRVNGKPLKANLSEYWRYRVGQYRILAEIKDDIITIVIINIGHRKDIYK